MMGDSDDVLNQLPKAFRAKFPLTKTRELGIMHDLHDFLIHASTTSLCPSEIQHMLEYSYGSQYHRRVLSYYAGRLDSRLQFEEKMKNLKGLCSWPVDQVEISSAEPTLAWKPPSIDFITDCQLKLLQERKTMYDQYMASLGGIIFSMDILHDGLHVQNGQVSLGSRTESRTGIPQPVHRPQ